MKANLKITVLFLIAIFIYGCSSDTEVSSVILKLTPDKVQGKSGQSITATLNIDAINSVEKVVIFKTINLVKDETFGDVVVTPELVKDNEYVYTFNYELSPDEVEKLVGFNFHVLDKNGSFAEKDLTVNTVMSGWQTIFSRKWKLTSRMWTSVTPAVEDKKECEKDDVYRFNQDGTYDIDFGEIPCDFDGFNVYDSWELSEDEKTFTLVYHSIFDPSNITTDVYNVRMISSEKLVVWVTMDLTIFGLTDKEVFESTFEAIP